MDIYCLCVIWLRINYVLEDTPVLEKPQDPHIRNKLLERVEFELRGPSPPTIRQMLYIVDKYFIQCSCLLMFIWCVLMCYKQIIYVEKVDAKCCPSLPK